MKILSWNVNGIRAIEKKGFLNWILKERPDILCIQETKAMEDQIPDHIKDIREYNCFFSSAERKGYSGVGLFSKEKPKKIKKGIEIKNLTEREEYLLQNIRDSFSLTSIFQTESSQKNDYSTKWISTTLFLQKLHTSKKEGKK